MLYPPIGDAFKTFLKITTLADIHRYRSGITGFPMVVVGTVGWGWSFRPNNYKRLYFNHVSVRWICLGLELSVESSYKKSVGRPYLFFILSS